MTLRRIDRRGGRRAAAPAPGMGTRTPFAAVVLSTLLALSCGDGPEGRSARPHGPAVRVVPAAAALDGESARILEAAGVEEFLLDAGTVGWSEGLPVVRPDGSAYAAVPEGTPVTLAVGVESGVREWSEEARAALGESLRGLASAAESRGLLPLGLHLEPAAGDAALPAGLLRSVRTVLGSGLLLSTSIPREALAGGRPDEAATAAARAVDFVVVPLYGHRPEAPDDPESWDPERVRGDLAALRSLEVDFLAGLHVVGCASRLSASGERIDGALTTNADVKRLALDPSLRLNIDPFSGDGRLLYTFQVRQASRGHGWPLSPGEAVRVSRTAPALVRWVLDLLDRSELGNYSGPLFHRIAAREELLALAPEEIAGALGSGPAVPLLEWRVVVESRQSDSVILEVELVNRGREGTDLATTEGNYLEVKSQNGHFVAVEPGDFSRYTLWRGDREARPGTGWREPDGVRLSTPLVHGGERIGGASLRLRTGGAEPRLSIGGRFLLTGGRALDLPVVSGPVGEGLVGSSEGDPAVQSE